MSTVFAQDRRTVDQDGRLHVTACRISKANVCPYFGREIPGWESMGLDANRVYHMYRDPDALRAAAASFINVPLMLDHLAVNVDAPAQELIAGTVSNARYEHPYLVADVAVWTREAIDGIESNDRRELSCAYRYTASMIGGTSPDGVRYDGRMIGPIQANHVALVAEGRAGPDVLVADEAPRMKRPKIMTALAAILGTLVKPEQLVALDAAMSEEIEAEDKFPDLDDDEKKAAKDAGLKALGKDSMSDEEERECYTRAAKDKKTALDAAAGAAAPAGPEGGAPKPSGASDEAIAEAVTAATANMISKDDAAKLATDAATAARAEVLALHAARDAVAAKCGVVVLDSAEAVYRFALDASKVAHADVPAVALAALYAATAGAPPLAADAAPVARVDIRDIFTGLSYISRRG